MATKTPWTEDRVAKLTSMVTEGVEVTQAELAEIAAELETTTRSIGSKLRKMGYTVELASNQPKRSWTETEEAELRSFLNQSPNQYTYAEIAAALLGGKFTAKMVQGKILNMELTGLVKPAEKVEAQRSYSPDEEAVFLEMAQNGASMEAIAEALGRELRSVRGKALSFIRTIEGFTMPAQEQSHAKVTVDPWDSLDVANMTVAEIAEAIERTERGVKTALTRRALSCKDYDGAKKAAKNAAKEA